MPSNPTHSVYALRATSALDCASISLALIGQRQNSPQIACAHVFTAVFLTRAPTRCTLWHSQTSRLTRSSSWCIFLRCSRTEAASASARGANFVFFCRFIMYITTLCPCPHQHTPRHTFSTLNIVYTTIFNRRSPLRRPLSHKVARKWLNFRPFLRFECSRSH